MRAAVATGINEDKPLSMLELRDDWPDPIAPEGHTLVRVGSTSINMHDLWSMRGVGVRADQFPMVLGCDIAGWDQHGNEVVVSGSFGNPDAGHGDESFDPARALVSERFPGSFAEYTIVPTRHLVPKPAYMTLDEAGCITVAWTTAYRMLFTRGYAEPGETVGEATWNHSLRSVRPGGRIVVSGATTGSDPSADLARVFYRQISIIGVSGASRVETEQLLRFMEAADLHPVVDSVYPFERIHAAFERAQQPDLYGKVVVRVGQS